MYLQLQDSDLLTGGFILHNTDPYSTQEHQKEELILLINPTVVLFIRQQGPRMRQMRRQGESAQCLQLRFVIQ